MRVDIPDIGLVEFPDGMSQAQIIAAIESEIIPQFRSQQQPQAQPAANPNKTNLLGDTAGALISGVGSLAEFPGQVYGLATGDFDNMSTRAGQALRDYGETWKSEGLRERERLIREQIKAAEAGGFGDEVLATLKGYLSDPRALMSLAIEQIPSMLATVGGGKLAQMGVGVAARRGTQAATQAALSRAGVAGAVGTSAAMQGASVGGDTYEDIMGLPDDGTDRATREAQALSAARMAGATGAAISGATAALLPGVEKGIFGRPGAGSLPSRVGKGFIGEAGQEALEEGGGRTVQNIGVQQVDESRPLLQGVGTAATLGGLTGGIMGGAVGMRPAGPTEQQLREAEDRQLLGGLRQLDAAREPPANEIASITDPEAAREFLSINLPDKGNLENLTDEAALAQANTLFTAFGERLGQQQEESVLAEQLKPPSLQSFLVAQGMVNKFTPQQVAQALGTTRVPQVARALAAERKSPEGIVEWDGQTRSYRLKLQEPPAAAPEGAPPVETAPTAPTPTPEMTAPPTMPPPPASDSNKSRATDDSGMMMIGGKIASFKTQKDAQQWMATNNQNDWDMVIDPANPKRTYLRARPAYNQPEWKDSKFELVPFDFGINTGRTAAQRARQVKPPPMTAMEAPPVPTAPEPTSTPPVTPMAPEPTMAEPPVAPPPLTVERPNDTVPPPAAPDAPQLSTLSTDPVEAARAPQPNAPQADDLAQQRERAWTIINERLDKIRQQGRQGRLAAADLTTTLKASNLAPEQGLAAFRIAEQAIRIFGGEKLVRFDFTRDALPAVEINGKMVSPQAMVKNIMQTPRGVEAMMQFSLAPSALPVAGQNASHEAFHVLQSLFKGSEPKIDSILSSAFPEGKTLDGIDPVLLRKLKTTKNQRGVSYYDFLKRQIPDEDRSSELQAYTFGALVDAKINGTPMTGLKPTFTRFINYLADMKQRVGAALRGDGITAAGIMDRAERGGYGSLSRAAPVDGVQASELGVGAVQGVNRTDTPDVEPPAVEPMTASQAPQYSALSDDPDLVAAREMVRGKVVEKPGMFQRALGAITGAQGTTRLRGGVEAPVRQTDALVANSINQAHAGHLLDRLAKETGNYKGKSAGMALEIAHSGGGWMDNYIKRGVLTYDRKTSDFGVDTNRPSLTSAMQGRVRYDQLPDFQSYVVALQERDLRKVGKVGMSKMTPELAERVIRKHEAANPQWKDAAADIDKMNQALLDYAVATGTLDKAGADRLKSLFYTPLYRQAEEDAEKSPGEVIGPRVSDSLRNVKTAFDVKREGGEEALGELLENMTRNADMIMKAGAKNVAMQTAADMMVDVGLGKRVHADATGDNIISLRQDGRVVKYQVDDQFLFAALAGMPRPIQNGIYQTMARMGGFFRDMITAAPSFIWANLWRGKIVAYAQEGASLSPMTTYRGFKQALMGGASQQAFTAQTGFGGYDYGMGARNAAKSFAATLDGAPLTSRLWKQSMGRLLQFSENSELAERIALQDKLIADGVPEKDAAFQAYMLAPFSRRGLGGGWLGQTLSFMVPLVPFLNAKIQGMYRLVENEKNSKRIAGIPKEIFLRGLVVTAFSTLLATLAAESDPDRWENESVDTKLRYDIIYLPDNQKILLPRSFEIGTWFGAMPVFAIDEARSQHGGDFAKALGLALISTFGFMPIPQAMVPVLQVATNYDFFRGRELQSKGDQSLPVNERVNRSTTTGAKMLAGAVNETVGQLPRGLKVELSPIQAQSLIEGYTGTMGSNILAAFDAILGMTGAIKEKPAGAFGPASSAPAIVAGLTGASRFYRNDEQTVARFVGDFYNIRELVQQTTTSFNRAKETGDFDRIRELQQGKEGLPLRLRPIVNAANTQVTELNKRMRMIEKSDLDPEEMTVRLNPLRKQRDLITQRVVERARELGVY